MAGEQLLLSLFSLPFFGRSTVASSIPLSEVSIQSVGSGITTPLRPKAARTRYLTNMPEVLIPCTNYLLRLRFR